MIKTIFHLVIFLIGFSLYGQNPKKVLKKMGEEPVFFVDSLNVNQSELTKYDPTEIASVTVFKDKEAVDLLGEIGKDGVVYIETVNFAKNRYWQYFISKSEKYLDIVPDVKADSVVLYILNKKILDKNFEGTLSTIDDIVFEGIEIIDKEKLQSDYKINDKEYGVIIKSGKPKNLYKAKKQF